MDLTQIDKMCLGWGNYREEKKKKQAESQISDIISEEHH